MIRLLQLKCISYCTGFSFQVVAILLINKIHKTTFLTNKWHLLYFAYGKYNKSCSFGLYHIKNNIKRTEWSSGDHLTLKFLNY